GPGGACGPPSWGDGTAGGGPSPPGPPEASRWAGGMNRLRTAAKRTRGREAGRQELWSRSRAGLRSHPGVRHGALRRRWREWERPDTVSWRPAEAGDAGWMFGKSRTRLAPVLTEAPSWMSDRNAQHEVSRQVG